MRPQWVVNRRHDRYIFFMTKQNSSNRSLDTGKVVTIAGVHGSRGVKTRLGNVTVSGAKPSAELVRTNIARSTEALERVGKTLIKPGVRLPEKKGVPRYSADENSPGVFIRRLNGEVTTGRLQDGRFVETE